MFVLVFQSASCVVLIASVFVTFDTAPLEFTRPVVLMLAVFSDTAMSSEGSVDQLVSEKFCKLTAVLPARYLATAFTVLAFVSRLVPDELSS